MHEYIYDWNLRQGLNKFGVSFLNHIECAEVSSPILSKITLIDTPGNKQNIYYHKEYEREISTQKYMVHTPKILNDFSSLET